MQPLVCSYLLPYRSLVRSVAGTPKTQGSALTFPCPTVYEELVNLGRRASCFPHSVAAGIWTREHLPCSLWRGYLASDGFLWSGHWLALLFSVVQLAFICLWAGGMAHLLGSHRDYALTFVLLLLLNLNLVLAFFAFFLDRFRIPVLVPLVCLHYLR